MNTDLMRYILLGILISFLSLHSLDVQAQSPEASAPAQADEADGTDDVSTLDLFDEDAGLSKKGWLRFYVSAGFMYQDGDGKFSARLPDGNEVTILDFDRVGLKETDSSY
jgi:hypothetical protein